MLSKKFKKFTVGGRILKKMLLDEHHINKRQKFIFVSDFDNLLDIAHKDILSLIIIKGNKEFLLAQRDKRRNGSMGPIDTKLSKKRRAT